MFFLIGFVISAWQFFLSALPFNMRRQEKIKKIPKI